MGGSCVYDGSLQCMCRGPPVGDFKGSAAIRLRVASLSQIAQLTPEALSTSLRTLLSLVCVLFGGMLLLAAAAYTFSFSKRRAILRDLRAPPSSPESVGFLALESGAWLWAVPPVALDGNGRLGGALVRISEIMGLPYVRVRAALPEELFRGSLIHAVGRTDALSVAALSSAVANEYGSLLGGGGGGGGSQLGSVAGGVAGHAQGGGGLEAFPLGGGGGGGGGRKKGGAAAAELGALHPHGGGGGHTKSGGRQMIPPAEGEMYRDSDTGPGAAAAGDDGGAVGEAAAERRHTDTGGAAAAGHSGASQPIRKHPVVHPPPAADAPGAVAVARGGAGDLVASLVQVRHDVGEGPQVISDSEWLCGTALVFAFILVARLLPVTEARASASLSCPFVAASSPGSGSWPPQSLWLRAAC